MTLLPHPKWSPMAQRYIVEPEANSLQGNVRLIWRLSPLSKLHVIGAPASKAVPFR